MFVARLVVVQTHDEDRQPGRILMDTFDPGSQLLRWRRPNKPTHTPSDKVLAGRGALASEALVKASRESRLQMRWLWLL